MKYYTPSELCRLRTSCAILDVLDDNRAGATYDDIAAVLMAYNLTDLLPSLTELLDAGYIDKRGFGYYITESGIKLLDV